MKRISYFAIGLVAIVLCSCNKPASNSIAVGEFASLTGSEETFGKSSHEGTTLAVEKINATDGVFGRQVSLITKDNESAEGKSKVAVEDLIVKDRVVAVIGEVVSSRSLEAAPVCQSHSVPQISPSATSPEVTAAGDFVFRVCFTDSFQGAVMAEFAKHTLKANRIAVLTDVKSNYSKGLAHYFKETFVNEGGHIVAELDYHGDDGDFKKQLEAIKSADSQGLFVPGYYADAARICVQAKELHLAVPIFGGDGWESDKLLEIGKDAVEGQYFSTHFSVDAPGENAKTFVAAYKARYEGKTPDATAALGYDAAMILFDSFKRAGCTDGPKVRDALASTTDFDGVTGKITINRNRDADKAVIIVQVRNGTFAYVTTVKPPALDLPPIELGPPQQGQ